MSIKKKEAERMGNDQMDWKEAKWTNKTKSEKSIHQKDDSTFARRY